MREVVIDCETTGLDPAVDRIIEIGALEIGTERRFHHLINPGIPIQKAATDVHGIKDADVADKPKFAQIVTGLLGFIAGAKLIAHNAPFDIAFLNAEIERSTKLPPLSNEVVDTLDLAKVRFPGARLSLDALCRRIGISLQRRKFHGALLDCELLIEVYFELQGGRQGALSFDAIKKPDLTGRSIVERIMRTIAIADEEIAAHEQFIETIPDAIWSKYIEEANASRA